MSDPTRNSVAWCPDCGKACFTSRADARRAVRKIKGRKSGAMHAYRCGEYWHLTSTPAVVVARWRDYRDELSTDERNTQ